MHVLEDLTSVVFFRNQYIERVRFGIADIHVCA